MITKKRIYIIISLFLLAALAMVLFVIIPMFNSIKEESGRLISEKNRLAALRSQFEKAEVFKKNYTDYKPDLDKVDNLFIDSNNPVAFIEFLEKTAKDIELDLRISPPVFSGEKNGSEPSFAYFQLSFSGDFTQIMKFLNKLELGPYLVEINNLSVDSKTTSQTDKDKKTTKTIKQIQANLDIKVLSR